MPACPHCAVEVPQSAAICPVCGHPLEMTASPPRIETKISGQAIAALYLGMASLVLPIVVIYLSDSIPAAIRYFDNPNQRAILITLLSLLSIVLAVVSIRAGWKARKRIKGSDGKLKGKGRAWAGLIVGCLGIILYLPIVVASTPFALGFGWLCGSRLAANQASAVGSLRTVHDQAEIYRATYHRGFPMQLAVLGPPRGGSPPNVGGANLINETLASGTISGYVFIYQVTARDENHFPTAYVVTAAPLAGCGSGTGNCYFTDETGVVRMELHRPPDQHSPPLAG